MRPKGPNRRDWVAGEIADRQHGVIARWQLIAAGVSPEAIARSLKSGRLRPMFRGVYAVGHAAVSTDGWCPAALLVCGEASVLGHHTACMKWDLRRGDLFPLSVIVPGDRGRKHDRIRTRRTSLDRSEWVRFDGLRVTTPARTVVDMAGELRPKEMRLLVERAQDLRRFNATRIKNVLEANPPPGLSPTAPPDRPTPIRPRRREVLPRAPIPEAHTQSTPAAPRSERQNRRPRARLRLA